ncbi:DMT family transporter [Rhizobium tumorigenes]|uniref:DMT family transporter n=1 Tax=Rhizobium tumorigenes TaxID=2041385 RepID=A0AAF1KT28_9HYPH|nr:DMT family transporter [Rhizobium tumorigenes]WFR98333.1 DMT family transporter [Rhizobium tumorigenes]WFS03120.1 DMT family transporter [Rhizobium tumorigenes]WFS03848.1 DMT family transporter [Rhizobium tumorigenes]
MLTLIGLALLNGILIATSRVINGHLGRKVGAIRTALWAHAVGFIFLSVIIATMFRNNLAVEPAVPTTAWLGGILGVAFVALNSHAVPRLGAGKTTSFVVGAQMLASMAIDSLSLPFSEATMTALGGAAIIVAGVWMAAFVSKK